MNTTSNDQPRGPRRSQRLLLATAAVVGLGVGGGIVAASQGPDDDAQPSVNAELSQEQAIATVPTPGIAIPDDDAAGEPADSESNAENGEIESDTDTDGDEFDDEDAQGAGFDEEVECADDEGDEGDGEGEGGDEESEAEEGNNE